MAIVLKMQCHLMYSLLVHGWAYGADIQYQLKCDASETYFCHIVNFVFTPTQ